MLRPIASRLVYTTNTGAVLKRYASVVGGPPTKRISTSEKYILAATMITCLVATPVYILSNLKHYRAPKA